MADITPILALLREHAATPRDLEGMARFGMEMQGRIGVRIPVLRRLARQIGRDHERALALWDTGIPDAQILAAFTAEPKAFTARQMDAWVKTMRSWDVCDQACNNAFAGSPLAWDKVDRWAGRQQEFVRRAAFALLASLAVHDKGARDEVFLARLPLIEQAAEDDRNFVKKAVNWALRQIGKRNAALHGPALQLAQRLQASASRPARWVGADAARELAGR
ncbi:MAG: DNA alkylation repair protein [Pseudomonadota bacterium]